MRYYYPYCGIDAGFCQWEDDHPPCPFSPPYSEAREEGNRLHISCGLFLEKHPLTDSKPFEWQGIRTRKRPSFRLYDYKGIYK